MQEVVFCRQNICFNQFQGNFQIVKMQYETALLLSFCLLFLHVDAVLGMSHGKATYCLLAFGFYGVFLLFLCLTR